MKQTTDSLKNRIREMERQEIVGALRNCNWVMAQAARKLGITERMIGYKIKKYGIRIKEVRWVEDSREDGCAAPLGAEWRKKTLAMPGICPENHLKEEEDERE